MKKQKFTNFFAANKSLIYCVMFWAIIFVTIFVVTEQLNTSPTTAKNKVTRVYPKYDSAGGPIYTESKIDQLILSKDNGAKYKGFFVSFGGRLGRIMTEYNDKVAACFNPNDSYPNTSCDKSLILLFDQNYDLESDDYVKVVGYIDNAINEKEIFSTGSNTIRLTITATKIEKSTYNDVFHPTIRTVFPENQIATDNGLTMKIDKIEFAQDETRVYFTVDNNSLKDQHPGGFVAYIIQDKEQYIYKSSCGIDPFYSMKPGVTDSGYVNFEAIKQADFKLLFDGDGWKYEFDISI